MAEEKKYVAVDLGAESGRAMLGIVSPGGIKLEEVHRFSNGPLKQDGSLRWDFGRLMSEIKTGIGKTVKQAKGQIAGIGVDSWGVDFGLLDEKGKLIENPYHYRDSRTNGLMEKAYELMPQREIYAHTGIQFMQFNTIYQLLAMRLANSPALKKAKQLILIADLVSYFLCGKAFAEYTLASTSQLMDMKTGKWSREVFTKLGLPMGIMPKVVPPGKAVGKLTADVAKEIGCEQIPVIATGSHDTASAVAAVPGSGGKWAYLSSGTWSLMGVEVPKAIVNDETYALPFTNEGGVEDTIRLLKNIMGLWLVQECRRQWKEDGEDLSYAQITSMAEKARPFAASINVDDSGFIAPGEMPNRINQHLAKTGRGQISDKGQMVRMVLECLAIKYRQVMERIEEVTGAKIDRLHVVGGGSQNELLNQFTANAIARPVIAGPVEATALGNLLMLAKAAGQIKNLAHGRELITKSFALKEFKPQNTAEWEKQYKQTIK